jgi:hypothetical protein
MTPAQTALYFREWGKVRAVLLVKGIDPKQADAKRHALHKKALGADKSSKDFTNADLDKVLAEFYAITRPGDLGVQLRQQEQVFARKEDAAKKIEAMLAEIGSERNHAAYVDGIVRKVIRGKKSWDELNDREANVLVGVLLRRVNYQRRARAKLEAAQAAADDNVPW